MIEQALVALALFGVFLAAVWAIARALQRRMRPQPDEAWLTWAFGTIGALVVLMFSMLFWSMAGAVRGAIR